MTGIQI